MAKVLVSLDDNLLERLDKAASERRVSRSALIAELTAKGLGERIGPGADPRVHEAIRRMRELVKNAPPGDSTEWIRHDRDSH
jgi:metal-responsive CopG/Arc/MetJ family transcriptional regulator